MKQQRDNQTKTKENKAKQNIPDQSATHSKHKQRGKKKKKKKTKTKKQNKKRNRKSQEVTTLGIPAWSPTAVLTKLVAI